MTNQQAGVFIAILGLMFAAAAFIILICDKRRAGKYTETVSGTVIGHKWKSTGEHSYPYAIVAYEVDGKEYRCRQTYRSVSYNSAKHARYDWELDEKYRLHSYVTRKCDIHINPTEDMFPIGLRMPVQYVYGKPHKVYCGALAGLTLMEVIMGSAGIFIFLFGLALHFVL